MKPLPKVPFAGRMCRIRLDEGLSSLIRRVGDRTGYGIRILPIESTKWEQFWLRSSRPIASSTGLDDKDEDGLYAYPFLLRSSQDRFIITSREAALVEHLLELGGVAGHVDSPRVQADRLARALIFPEQASTPSRGRRYTISSVYAAVEGYGRALRSVSFFGEDLAEAELFRTSLDQLSVHRIGLRDPKIDKDLLSISTTGEIDFRFRGIQHLNALDSLTSFLRASGYLEWREGVRWEPDLTR